MWNSQTTRTRIYINKNCNLLILSILFCFSFFSSFFAQNGNIISIDVGQTYQTINGWEATAQAGGQADAAFFYRKFYPLYIDTLLDLTVYDLGINRLQVTVRCGSENPVNYFQQFLDSLIGLNVWKNNRYQIINDDSDPFHINWAGFYFTELDCTMSNLVIPVKNRLEANNDSLYFHLDYVDFGSSSFEHYTNPEEYAEFILATFIHLENKFGIVPDAIEVKLEPDNSGGWNDGGTKLARALVAAGQRLASHGYFPDFIAPSTIRMDRAISYFDVMIQYPNVLQYLTELSYHRYDGVSLGNLQQIAQRGNQYGINTSMLEWWNDNNSYKTLHEDLKIGNNSAWQQGAIAFPGSPLTNLYWIDDSNPAHPKVEINDMTKFTRQYYKFIRAGAIRVKATSTNSGFDPLAFRNVDGNFVVVIKADYAGYFSITGLTSGTYGIKYTTPNEYDKDLPSIIIQNGDSLTTNIPDEGVMTIYYQEPVPTSNDKHSNIFRNFFLYQNYPNPFNAQTTIQYQLFKKSAVELSVMNNLGQTVSILIDKIQMPGRYRINWSTSQLASGIYFCRLSCDNFSHIMKMLLVK